MGDGGHAGLWRPGGAFEGIENSHDCAEEAEELGGRGGDSKAVETTAETLAFGGGGAAAGVEDELPDVGANGRAGVGSGRTFRDQRDGKAIGEGLGLVCQRLLARGEGAVRGVDRGADDESGDDGGRVLPPEDEGKQRPDIGAVIRQGKEEERGGEDESGVGDDGEGFERGGVTWRGAAADGEDAQMRVSMTGQTQNGCFHFAWLDAAAAEIVPGTRGADGKMVKAVVWPGCCMWGFAARAPEV